MVNYGKSEMKYNSEPYRENKIICARWLTLRKKCRVSSPVYHKHTFESKGGCRSDPNQTHLSIYLFHKEGMLTHTCLESVATVSHPMCLILCLILQCLILTHPGWILSHSKGLASLLWLSNVT